MANGILTPSAFLAEDRAARARTLEFASDYLEYLRIQGIVTQQESADRFRTILFERSTLHGVPKQDLAYVPGTPPHRTHKSSRASLTTGVYRKSTFSEISYRPASHDLLDPQAGFIPGAAIALGEFSLRYSEKQAGENEISLNHLTLLAISSLTADTPLFSPLSWKLTVRGERLMRQDGSREFTPYISGSVGKTYHQRDNTAFYLLGTGSIEYGSEYTDTIDSGIGISLGAWSDINSNLRVLLTHEILKTAESDDTFNHETQGSLRYTLGEDDAIVTQVSSTSRFERELLVIGVTWHHYF
jgi:hypothetical protein